MSGVYQKPMSIDFRPLREGGQIDEVKSQEYIHFAKRQTNDMMQHMERMGIKQLKWDKQLPDGSIIQTFINRNFEFAPIVQAKIFTDKPRFVENVVQKKEEQVWIPGLFLVGDYVLEPPTGITPNFCELVAEQNGWRLFTRPKHPVTGEYLLPHGNQVVSASTATQYGASFVAKGDDEKFFVYKNAVPVFEDIEHSYQNYNYYSNPWPVCLENDLVICNADGELNFSYGSPYASLSLDGSLFYRDYIISANISGNGTEIVRASYDNNYILDNFPQNFPDGFEYMLFVEVLTQEKEGAGYDYLHDRTVTFNKGKYLSLRKNVSNITETYHAYTWTACHELVDDPIYGHSCLDYDALKTYNFTNSFGSSTSWANHTRITTEMTIEVEASESIVDLLCASLDWKKERRKPPFKGTDKIALLAYNNDSVYVVDGVVYTSPPYELHQVSMFGKVVDNDISGGCVSTVTVDFAAIVSGEVIPGVGVNIYGVYAEPLMITSLLNDNSIYSSTPMHAIRPYASKPVRIPLPQ